MRAFLFASLTSPSNASAASDFERGNNSVLYGQELISTSQTEGYCKGRGLVESRQEKTKKWSHLGALFSTFLVPHEWFVFARALLSLDNGVPGCSHLGPTWSRVAANKLCQRATNLRVGRVCRKMVTAKKEREKRKDQARLSDGAA